MFKNVFIICFFIINIFKVLNLRCENYVKTDHVWKKKESEDYTYKHVNGYFCRDYKKSSYLLEKNYLMYDEKYKKGHGPNTNFVLQKYQQRLIFALEGFIIEFFGEKKEDVHSELMANEELEFYYQRRLTELIEYLYYIVKRDSSAVYTWKIPEEYLNIDTLVEWDSGKNMSVQLNKFARKKLLCNNAYYNIDYDRDKDQDIYEEGATDILEVWKLYYYPGKFNNFIKPNLTEEQLAFYKIRQSVPYKVDVLNIDPKNIPELQQRPIDIYIDFLHIQDDEEGKKQFLINTISESDINEMTGNYPEIDKYIETHTKYYAANRNRMKKSEKMYYYY